MGDEVREKILAEAKRLFFMYGWKRITMDEIAGAAKISKKTIYQYYPSKDDLVREVASRIFDAKINRLHEVIDSNAPVVEVFKGMFDIFRTLNQEVSEPMMQDIRSMPDLWKMIEEKRMSVFQRIESIIERGKKDGSLKPELNSDLFLRIYMGMLQRFANPMMLAELNLRPSDFIEQMRLIIFEGILTDKARA